MRARRALLYMPGDDEHKIHKATTLEVDCICMDIEDGVAQNRKAEARKTIQEALKSINFGGSERLVRLNPVSSRFIDEDLENIITSKPDGIVLPKVKNADQISWVDRKISAIESKSGWMPGSIIILAIIESALGIVNLKEIASSSSRLRGLIFGAEDLAADVGATRTEPGWEVLYSRSAVVTFAAAYGLQAIDLVNTDFLNLEKLRAESLQGVQMGFSGKQIIHPNQVKVVQESFTPTDDQVKNAQEVVAEYLSYQEKGRGAFVSDGKMIDAPIVKSALALLERAKAAGKITIVPKIDYLKLGEGL